ncbi:hypothetical protein P389DRAFT_3644 [Cystobasidium minutum MCA 4210]|uniref:mitochondrial 54S ribosomal protein mL61 n=1 Tax=Cystobasidium minutum MCA 4210 TaxID=1397322 RepID=UPI0034CD1C8F|eukprot:jgi/Rhomi1/3644/CE3643_1008
MDGMIEVIGEEACMSRKNRVRLHAKLSHFPTINNYIAAMSATVQRISKKTQSLTKKLERLRNGPLAISLPSKVKEVEMQFAFRNRDYGARRLLKQDIPSLLYKNPSLVFKQDRPERIPNPTLVVKYDDGNSTTINLKEKSHEDILSEFIQLFNSQASTSSSSSSSNITTSRPHPSSSKASSPTSSTTSSNTTPTTIETPPSPPAGGEVEAGVDVGTARQ